MPKPTFTRAQFDALYPNDDAILDALFMRRFGHLPCCPKCGVVAAEFYRVLGRRCYACMHCRYQLFPTADTIMHRSTRPLRDWFVIMYNTSISRNNVATLELQRELGGSYKALLRITHKIRGLMKQSKRPLKDIVEVDECYIGGCRSLKNRWENKIPVFGVIERGGGLRIMVSDSANATTAAQFLRATVVSGSTLNTDETPIYNRVAKQYYKRQTVQHGAREYVKEGGIYTNQIEGVWGRWKPSLTGTHRSVSKRYLQLYADEYVWKYEHREEPNVFEALLGLAVPPAQVSH